MRIGLVCPDVPGHLNPMTTLGAELQQRGHEVVVLGLAPARKIVERAKLEFVCLDENGELSEKAQECWAQLAASSNLRSMFYTGQAFGLVTKIHQEFLADAVVQNGVQGIVLDQFSPAALMIGNKLELPCAIVSNALAMYMDPLAPPPPLPWGFRRDLYGRIRNQLAAKILPLAYYWMGNAKGNSVDPFMLLKEPGHGLVQIAQQPAFFDFPRQNALPLFHYTAPWHRPNRDDGSVEFPWDWLDGRPLIYASMGTLQNRLSKVFDNIVKAARGMPVQVVLSKGGGKVEIQEPLPENVLAVEFAPQLRLLEKASVAITHAGLNTVLECLSSGVPMLCMPVTNDQPGVAKRVQWIGAGRLVTIPRASSKRIRSELEILLEEPSYLAQAQDAKAQLTEIDGVGKAADLVVQAFTQKTQIRNPLHAEYVAQPSHSNVS